MWGKHLPSNVAFPILGIVACLMLCTFVEGQSNGQTRWTKISSSESREGKSLRNTFPFSETAHHDHGNHDHHHDDHHHHHESEASNSRNSNSGFSLPGLS